MIFKASKKQLRQVAAAATNASRPVGMGFLHYDSDRVFTPDDFKGEIDKSGLNLDYVQGRMVKIRFAAIEGKRHYYRTYTDETNPEYESWCATYATYTDLLKVAGIVPEVES